MLTPKFGILFLSILKVRIYLCSSIRALSDRYLESRATNPLLRIRQRPPVTSTTLPKKLIRSNSVFNTTNARSSAFYTSAGAYSHRGGDIPRQEQAREPVPTVKQTLRCEQSALTTLWSSFSSPLFTICCWSAVLVTTGLVLLCIDRSILWLLTTTSCPVDQGPGLSWINSISCTISGSDLCNVSMRSIKPSLAFLGPSASCMALPVTFWSFLQKGCHVRGLSTILQDYGGIQCHNYSTRVDPAPAVLNSTHNVHQLQQAAMDLSCLIDELSETRIAIHHAGIEIASFGADHIDMVGQHSKLNGDIFRHGRDLRYFSLALQDFLDSTSRNLMLFDDGVQVTRAQAQANSHSRRKFDKANANLQIDGHLNWFSKGSERYQLRRLLSRGNHVKQILIDDERTWNALAEWRTANNMHDMDKQIYDTRTCKKWSRDRMEQAEQAEQRQRGSDGTTPQDPSSVEATAYGPIRETIDHIMMLLREEYARELETAGCWRRWRRCRRRRQIEEPTATSGTPEIQDASLEAASSTIPPS